MKRIITLASAVSFMLLTISCKKEFTPEVNPIEETVLTECTFTASIEDSKLTLNGLKSSWDNGDEIAVCQSKKLNATDNRDATLNKFTAQSSGDEVYFKGTIANYKAKEEGGQDNEFIFTYPFSAIGSYNGSIQTLAELTVPSTQTGQIADFGKYAHYNNKFVEDATNTIYDGGKLSFNVNVSLTCITPVIKFNVPVSLNATKIEIYGSNETGAPVGITGKYTYRLSGSTAGFTPANESKLTIFNKDNVISGETYAVLAPTSMTGTRALQNDATTLTFKIYSGETLIGGFEGNLSGNQPKNGVIMDLGTLPTTFNQMILNVVPDSSFPTSSSKAVRTDTDFYSEGYKFTVLANDDGGTNYTKLYYSSSYITWTKGDSTTDAQKLPLGTYVYIKIPAIPGYTLSKATFFSNNNSKTAYIYDTLERSNSLGSVKLPSTADENKLYTINVSDPGNLSEYYFVVGFTSTIKVKNLKLYYTKKPE